MNSEDQQAVSEISLLLAENQSLTDQPSGQSQICSQQRFRFLIPDTWAGGVTIIAAQWARELTQRGWLAEVVFLKDRSATNIRAQDQGLFEGIRSCTVEYDSLDKASRFSKEVLARLRPEAGDLFVVNSCHRNPVDFLQTARRRGSAFHYIQLVVNDNDGNYRNVARSLPDCDLIVALSQRLYVKSVQLAVQHNSSVPIVQIPPGTVQHPPSVRPALAGGCRICFVGRVEAVQKRVFDLVRIMDQVRRKGTEFQLTIVGDGGSRVALESAFREAGLQRHVVFTGRQSHSELLQILRQQHIFVFPSQYEGFGVVLCEAMAAGVVPICTRVAGPEDVVIDGENGFLADIGDVRTMAQRICDLAGNECLWNRLSDNALQTARAELTVAASVDQLATAVQQLAAAPDRPRLSSDKLRLGLDSPLVPNAASRIIRKLWRRRQARKHLIQRSRDE